MLAAGSGAAMVPLTGRVCDVLISAFVASDAESNRTLLHQSAIHRGEVSQAFCRHCPRMHDKMQWIGRTKDRFGARNL
jgi:hypothetical protein